MTELAWMKTYIGDEAAVTGHLTAEEFGAYERIRRHIWQHGAVPDDDRRLMRITGVDADRWEEVRSGICDLFEDGWRLPRLDEEHAAASEKRERKVAAGRKGAETRWQKESGRKANAIPNANGKRMAEPLAEALDNQWPPAPAPDEVRYEERLAPTRTHARDGCFAIPENESMGRAFLRDQGLNPKQVQAAITPLMAGSLDRVLLDQISLT